MREMARDMNRFFEGFGLSPLSGDVGRMLESSPFRSGSSTWPAIEVFDRDGRMVIRAELPGMKKEDVHVRTVDNYMIIEGERRSEQEQQREGFYQSEWSYGRFSRAITLPERVEPQQVSARFENGVLEVSLDLPRRASQEIPIEAGSHSGRIGSATNAPSQGQPGTGGASKVREQPGGP
jgi:HSP20 family protein